MLDAHEGRCRDKIELALCGGRGGPWHELDEHLHDVVAGVGKGLAELMRRELDLTPTLPDADRADLERKVEEAERAQRDSGLRSPLFGWPADVSEG